MRQTVFKCAPHQFRTLSNLTDPILILVSGYRGGKTWTGSRWIVDRALRNPPGLRSLVLEPTWSQIKSVAVPEIVAALESREVPFSLNQSDFTFKLPGRREIICRSGDRPESVKGITAACGWMDEPAVQDSAMDEVFSTRVSDPAATIRQRLYTGTHEGASGWFYEMTHKYPTITVPMWANIFLSDDTIASIKDRFNGDEARFKMYVEGQAQSLAGSIYSCYAERHRRKCANPGDGHIAIGADLNVGLMCWPIARVLNGELHVFAEVVSRNTTTEAHVERVKQFLLDRNLATFRQGQFGPELVDRSGQRVDVHMDASGTARKTSATRTDKTIVRDAGLWPRSPSSNPLVKDRIETVQYAFSHDRAFVDPAGAPFTDRALRLHEYERGSSPPQPKKHWGSGEEPLDAATDAFGYLATGVTPVLNRRVLVG